MIMKAPIPGRFSFAHACACLDCLHVLDMIAWYDRLDSMIAWTNGMVYMLAC